MTAKLIQTAKTFRKEASAPQGDGTAPQRGYACRKSARMKRHRNETDKERTKNGKQHFYQGRRAGKGVGHLAGSGVQNDCPVERGTESQGLHDRGRPGKQEVLSGEDLRGRGGVIGCQPTRTTGRAHGTLPSTSRMLMCDKVTHKNLIDNRPLFRYYSSIWIEKTALIQYNKVSGRYLYEGKNTNH